ncbi:hypothetical protein [Caulobacter sp. 602-1]|uniref:hypothetical protein n=1 Tax=Caulobacter sp. 602-1 TaxID=2492472 RepID=UPI000F638F50|nr:hypothetical protein [Caulobacter sp. 602-1]RRN63266.1 hypothetical protein EIK80_15600 [Caulobacter sp. 602-1]
MWQIHPRYWHRNARSVEEEIARYTRSEEYKKGFAGGVTGVGLGLISAAIFNLSASIDWIEKHNGMASWVQAFGSISAILWGVWIYRSSIRQKEKDMSESRRSSIRTVVKVLRLAAEFTEMTGETVTDFGERESWVEATNISIDEILAALSDTPITFQWADGMVETIIWARGRLKHLKMHMNKVAKYSEDEFARYQVRLRNGHPLFEDLTNKFRDQATALLEYM